MKSLKHALAITLGFSQFALAEGDPAMQMHIEELTPRHQLSAHHEISSCTLKKPIQVSVEGQMCAIDDIKFEVGDEEKNKSAASFYKNTATIKSIHFSKLGPFGQCKGLTVADVKKEQITKLKWDFFTKATDENKSCFYQYEQRMSIQRDWSTIAARIGIDLGRIYYKEQFNKKYEEIYGKSGFGVGIGKSEPSGMGYRNDSIGMGSPIQDQVTHNGR